MGSFGPGVHVDVILTHSAYLNIVADQIHTFMPTVFPDIPAGAIMQPLCPTEGISTLLLYVGHQSVSLSFAEDVSPLRALPCTSLPLMLH